MSPMCFEFESLKRRNQYCSVMQSDSRICIRAQNNVSFISTPACHHPPYCRLRRLSYDLVVQVRFVLMFLLLLFSILPPLLLLMMGKVKTFLTNMTSTPKVVMSTPCPSRCLTTAEEPLPKITGPRARLLCFVFMLGQPPPS